MTSLSTASSPAQFRYLADLRRKEAQTLLRSKHWTGAFYLSGYIVECSLKARLASCYSGALPQSLKVHDIKQLIDAAQPFLNQHQHLAVASLPQWSHLTRYSCTAIAARTAVDFLNSCIEVHRCLLR